MKRKTLTRRKKRKKKRRMKRMKKLMMKMKQKMRRMRQASTLAWVLKRRRIKKVQSK
jgi:hypothetical protein